MRRGSLLVLLSVACASPAPAQPITVVAPTPTVASAKPIAVEPPKGEPTDGPEPPPVHPYDPALAVDGGGLFNAASSKEIFLWFGDYTVIVDRSTGCAIESYPDWMHLMKGIVDAEELAKPETLKAIRSAVGLGRRLGVQGTQYNDHLAWSPDGRYVFFESGGILYRSTNGARSFSLVDNRGAGRLTMNGKGSHLVYERGNDFFVLGIDADKPKPLTTGQTFPLRADGPVGMQFWRTTTTEECLDTFDTTTAARSSAHCVTLPKGVVGGWNTREWISVSPNGHYGLVKWEVASPGLTYIVSLVDLTTDKVLKSVKDHLGDVDDDGNMVMSSVTEGGGDHTYVYPFAGPRRLIGNHALIGFHDHTAILSVWRKANLGARKCDLVKLVKIP